nr:MAG TPA: hypothetical protein [Caudoviricetes sp.]
MHNAAFSAFPGQIGLYRTHGKERNTFFVRFR